MIKIKKYLLLGLIFLQFIAPFVHAHEFGHDSFKEHTLHLHTDEMSNLKSANNALNQTQVGENQLIGAVTTVASGIKTSLADDIVDGIAAMAIFFSLALLIFGVSTRFIWQPIQALPTQRYFYALQNPRAPPR